MVTAKYGLEFRHVRVIGEFRIELSGFTQRMVECSKAIGLISEVLSWKLGMFLPTGEAGSAILARPIERHPFVRRADRAA